MKSISKLTGTDMLLFRTLQTYAHELGLGDVFKEQVDYLCEEDYALSTFMTRLYDYVDLIREDKGLPKFNTRNKKLNELDFEAVYKDSRHKGKAERDETKDVDMPEIVDWIAEHMSNSRVKSSDAPSPIAWNMFIFFKSTPAAKERFWSTVFFKHSSLAKEEEKATQFDNAIGPAMEHIEELQQLAESAQQDCAENA